MFREYKLLLIGITTIAFAMEDPRADHNKISNFPLVESSEIKNKKKPQVYLMYRLHGPDRLESYFTVPTRNYKKEKHRRVVQAVRQFEVEKNSNEIVHDISVYGSAAYGNKILQIPSFIALFDTLPDVFCFCSVEVEYGDLNTLTFDQHVCDACNEVGVSQLHYICSLFNPELYPDYYLSIVNLIKQRFDPIENRIMADHYENALVLALFQYKSHQRSAVVSRMPLSGQKEGGQLPELVSNSISVEIPAKHESDSSLSLVHKVDELKESTIIHNDRDKEKIKEKKRTPGRFTLTSSFFRRHSDEVATLNSSKNRVSDNKKSKSVLSRLTSFSLLRHTQNNNGAPAEHSSGSQTSREPLKSPLRADDIKYKADENTD